MAHQLKYYSDWHDANGVLHRVEFLKKDFTGTASEILLASFTINYPEIDLFGDDVLIGGGASFQIITPSPLALIDDFYIVDPFGMQVRHYIYESHENSNYVTNFIGYIDTEQFEDPISDGINYEIHVSANNGVAILNKMPITFPKHGQEEGKEATISVIELLKHCFDKLQIDFNSFKVNIGTKICPYPIPSLIVEDNHPYRGQPLHNIFVNRSNYYDEKENATSCRDSISQCLMPFYCKVVIYDNIIYILDVQSLRKTEIPELALIYYNSLYTPESGPHERLPNNLFSIDERVEAHNVSMSSGKNKVSIRLNKYTQKNPYEVPLDGTVMSDLVEKVPIYSDDGMVSNYEYRYSKAEGFQIIPQDLPLLQSFSHNQFVKKVGSGAHSSSAEYFIRLVAPQDSADSSFRLQVDTGLFITSAHQFIGLDMDVMFENASNPEEYKAKVYPRMRILPCLLSKKDGDCTNPNDLKAVYEQHQGRGWVYSWKDPSANLFKDGVTFGDITGTANKPGISFHVREFGKADDPTRMNKWYKINGNIIAYKTWIDVDNTTFQYEPIYSFLFPISNSFSYPKKAHPGGFLSFVFYVRPEMGISVNLIKNIKVYLLEVQEDQTDPLTGYNFFDIIQNTDVEFEGRSSLDFANELSIETNQGTASSNFSRASFFVYINKPYHDCPDFDDRFDPFYRWVRVEKFVRGKNVGNLEKLLLNSYLSNLKVSRYKLTVDLKGYFPFYKNFEFPMLKRNGQNVKLIPTSMSVDYETGISSFTMEEYNKEDLIP